MRSVCRAPRGYCLCHDAARLGGEEMEVAKGRDQCVKGMRLLMVEISVDKTDGSWEEAKSLRFGKPRPQ
jgi:hypothetical protein